MSMGSLSGFRAPQFSEDIAWLPAWLQPHTFSEHIKEGKSPFESTFKELPFPHQNTWTGENANQLSSEEDRYKSCHLFLSGEDSSPLSLAPSSSNVVHFRLHLSSNGYSENTQSSLLPISQAKTSESNHVLPVQHIGTSVLPEEQGTQFQCQVSQNADLVNVTPRHVQVKSDKLGPQSVNSNPDNVTDAIELSIAASEALLIHEVIESGSTRKSLPPSTILEVALRVKQARLEVFDETLSFSEQESSDIDCLSDLDELTMADTYEEVGVSFTAIDLHGCDPVISQSQVRDTYTSENYGSDDKLNCNEVETDSADTFKKQQSNGYLVKDTYASENCGSDDKFKDKEAETDSGDIFTKQQSKDDLVTDVQFKEDLGLEHFDSERQNKFTDDQALGLESSSIAFDVHPILNRLISIQENPDILSTTKIVDVAVEDVTSLQATLNSSPLTRIYENVAERDDLTYNASDKFESRWLGGWSWTQKNEVNASAAKGDIARNIPEYFIGETSLLSESADIAPNENSFVQHKRCTKVSQSSSHSIGNRNLDENSHEDAVNSSCPSMVDPLCSVVPCSISSENAYSAPENNQNNLQTSSSLDMEFVNLKGVAVQVTDAKGSQPIARRQVTALRNYSMLLPSDGAYLGEENKSRNCGETDKDEAELHIHVEKETGPPQFNSEKTIEIQASKSSMLDIVERNLERSAVPERDVDLRHSNDLQIAEPRNVRVPGRKRVRFAETNIISFPQKKKLQTLQNTDTNCSTRKNNRLENCYPDSKPRAQVVKTRQRKSRDKSSRRLIFQNIEFLLAGFSGKKKKEIDCLIRKYGGIVLSDIPSPPSSRARRSSRFKRQPLPVILCFKKLQTFEFLYGCAVNACILSVTWLTDSIAVGSVLPPKKYTILQNHAGENFFGIGKPSPCNKYIFDNVGFMFNGKPNFCTKMAKVVKHGGGLVFKTLQWLVQSLDDEKISVAAIITEDECLVSRHLKQCALERKIPVMPDSWIVDSLYEGKLLPFMKNNHLPPSCSSMLMDIPVSMETSEEI